MNKFKLLESLDSGSNYNFGEKMNQPKNPKSLFDLSHLVTMTMPNAGMVIPVSQFECLPGDDHDINVDLLLRVLPQVVPLYSRQRMYVYAFYNRYADLWNNWQVFMDKGYTGNVQKFVPHIEYGVNHTHSSSSDVVQPDTLFDYMGLPIGAKLDDLFGDQNSPSSLAYISALPIMALLRIYRDYFMNKTEFINDRVMLPDDDSRFRLDDDGQLLSAKDLNKKFYFDSDNNYDLTIDNNGDYHFSGFYHEYPDDYFISALPFTQRGTAPKLDYTVDLSQIGLDFSSSVDTNASDFVSPLGVIHSKEKIVGASFNPNTNDFTSFDSASTHLLSALNKAKLSGSNIGLEITLEDIRKLAIAQTELEILARTDGSYREFGLSFFGEPSKAAHDYRATYIGGIYKNIAFTEVLQTSESSNGNPLGNYAGHGITGIQNGRLGHIHCDDYGIITILCCIMPDIYYSQGLDRMFTDRIQEEKYLPIRSKLGLQPIYNKELFYAGNNGNSQGDDNYLWAYQNPFDHLRYIPSKIRGKIADPTNNSFSPYTQARFFTQLPNWGRDFSEANDVRKDYLAGGTSEDAYTCQFKLNIRSVREMPYKSVPAQIV